MKIFYAFSQFLLTQWIWSVTFGWHHAALNFLLCTIGLIFVAKRSMIESVLLACGSQLFALVIFWLLSYGLLGEFFCISFSATEQPTIVHPLATSFLLGIIYAGLQTLFFYLINFRITLPVCRYGVIAVLSNTIVALIIYKFLPPF